MNKQPMNMVDLSFLEVEKFIKKTSLENIVEAMKNNYFNWADNANKEYLDFLVKIYSEMFDWWGSFDPDNGDFEMIARRAMCLKEHIDDIAEMYFSFSDYISRTTLLGLLLYWFTFDINTFTRMQERRFDTYFDLDVFQCTTNEVFVDVGAYTGDSIMKYLANYGDGNYKRIIGYEINKQNLATARKNLKDYRDIDLRFKGVADKSGVLYIANSNTAMVSSSVKTSDNEYPVDTVTLDDDIDEPITFLKMDIEGADFAALQGAKRHIIQDRPKMALSIYHSNDDLWRIFKFLNEICVNYDYYMRFWACGPENLDFSPLPVDYMLLCVPR